MRVPERLSAFLFFSCLASSPLYATGPVTLAHWTTPPQEMRLTSDRKSGVIVAWIVPESSGVSLGAQALDFAGHPRWAKNRLALASGSTFKELRLASDHHGGAIFVWQDESLGIRRSWVQGISSEGGLRWPAPGLQISSATVPGSGVWLDVDDPGRIYLAWEELEGEHGLLRCQILEKNQPRWPGAGRKIALASSALVTPAITFDKENGFFVVWHNADHGSELLGQYVDSSNHLFWEPYGHSITTQAGSHPQIQSLLVTSDDELLVVWKEGDQPSDAWAAQSISTAGRRRWGDRGLVLTPAEAENASLSVNPDGKINLAWEDIGGALHKIFVQQWDRKGQTLWTLSGTAVTEPRDGEQRDPFMVAEQGDPIVLWLDNFDHPWDIYTQRFKSNGDRADKAGTYVTPAGSSPTRPMGCPDFSGGMVAVWLEAAASNGWQLQALRVKGSGTQAW